MLWSFTLNAQFDSKKYDKEYFLLGTLNEYLGYQRTFTNGDDFYYQRIDIMSKDELKHTLFIDSLFGLDYPDISVVNNGAPMGIKMYSPTLSQKIDEYYNYEAGSISTIESDTVYVGQLKYERFTTEKQKLSFLLGAYLRFGRDIEETNRTIKFLKSANYLNVDKPYENVSYLISLPNARTKAELCEKILRELECENVEYIRMSDRIPAGNLVLFKPSPIVLAVISDAEALKMHIETINSNHVEFTKDGPKFIWKESPKPKFSNN